MADAQLFRQAFRRFASTVAVLTYLDRSGAPSGMTATSLCSLSADPPSLLVCINQATRTHGEVAHRGRFGVNILSVGQRPIALYCSRAGEHKRLREEWLASDAPESATPRLAGALAHLECDIETSYPAFSHSVLVGVIRDVWLNPQDAPPLLYFGGLYSQLESAVERAERFHWETGAE